MSVRRIMGTETEYAVSAPKLGHYNPVQLSFDVVGAAANERTKHIRWDYRQEDPFFLYPPTEIRLILVLLEVLLFLVSGCKGTTFS